ncbi:conserved hypothetical protein [Vibrio nigripulchritudo SFn118]|nr:conserved hypothetical protein [Vibrio nigripulchritudo SFn118]
MEANMNNTLHSVIDTITSQLENSPYKNLLGSALKSCIEKQQNDIETLLLARQAGEISEEEFAIELEREKQIVEAEMLTWQITAKAEVQKVVNKAFHALTQAVLS